MSEILAAPTVTWKQGWQLLASSRMFEPAVLAWFTPFALLPALAFDSVRLGWRAEEAFLMAICGYLIPTAVFFLFWYVWCVRLRWQVTSMVSIIVLLFAGFVRGVGLYLIGNSIGILHSTDFWYRIIGAPVYVGICMGLVGTINVQRRAYLDQLAGLRVERHNLRLLQTGIQGQIETQKAQLSGRVQGLLGPAIWELNQYLASLKPNAATTEAVQRLRETVDEVVRPLSQDVTTAIQVPFEYGQAVQIAGNPSMDIPRRLNVSSMLGGGMIVVLAILIALVPTLNSFGLVVGFALLAGVAVIMWTGFFIASRLTKRLILPFWAAVTVLCLIGLAVAELTIFVDSLMPHRYLESWRYVNMPAGVVILTLVAFLNQLVKIQRERAVEDASRVNTRFAVLNSRLRQEMWLNQRRTAQLLHGPIQAALYASAMRLSATPKVDEKLLDQVRRDITSAVDQLTVESDFESQSFEDYLAQIVELWQDVCEITTWVSAEALSALCSNSTASECALEAVREAVNNAIKHGNAKHIEVAVAANEPGLIELMVSNDGAKFEPADSTGLGSTLLDEITHDWSISSKGDQTVFKARVAVLEQVKS